jgi:hypothetical protein
MSTRLSKDTVLPILKALMLNWHSGIIWNYQAIPLPVPVPTPAIAWHQDEPGMYIITSRQRNSS